MPTMSVTSGIIRHAAGAETNDSPGLSRSKRSLSYPSSTSTPFWPRISARGSSLIEIPNPPSFLPPRKPYFRPKDETPTETPSSSTENAKISVPCGAQQSHSLQRVSRNSSEELLDCDRRCTTLDTHCSHSSRQRVEKGLSARVQGSKPNGGSEICVGSEVPPLPCRSVFCSLGSSSWTESKLASKSLSTSRSDPTLFSDKERSPTNPYTRVDICSEASWLSFPTPLPAASSIVDDEQLRLPPPPTFSSVPIRSSPNRLDSKPKPSLSRISSLDSFLLYREEKANWKRSSSLLQQEYTPLADDDIIEELAQTIDDSGSVKRSNREAQKSKMMAVTALGPLPEFGLAISKTEQNKFRHGVAEVGFCFTIAMTQFLTEYLISGFAIELSKLTSKSAETGSQSQSMGTFWPASLLSVILSATLLIFARVSEMYGGYCIFMLGVAWLVIWTLIPGFCRTLIALDVSRAMQGLAVAAFMPSTFTMVGRIYPEGGPRKSFVLASYAACAPLGFFGGLLVAAALPQEKSEWYFWIASALSAITFITAFLTVPSDRTDRHKLDLKMDWIGSGLITSGLILVSYALSVEPYANTLHSGKPGFESPLVIGPLISGIGLLAIAFWYEGWCAKCPLMPFEFFKPKGVKALSLASLCFYATYGVWLYNSAEFFQSPAATTIPDAIGMSGISLALWYTPTAVGGIILCVVGGSLLHVVPTMALLLVSGLAWIAAPLLLAFAPLPLSYWKYVFGSMLCATIGIDLTFTVSIVFTSSVQPLRYQGLAGAVCSILVNLAMSFGLSISEIVAPSFSASLRGRTTSGLRATFIYGAASAGLGLIICILFVRISRSVMRNQHTDEEGLRFTQSASTLFGNREPHGAD